MVLVRNIDIIRILPVAGHTLTSHPTLPGLICLFSLGMKCTFSRGFKIKNILSYLFFFNTFQIIIISSLSQRTLVFKY